MGHIRLCCLRSSSYGCRTRKLSDRSWLLCAGLDLYILMFLALARVYCKRPSIDYGVSLTKDAMGSPFKP